MNQDRLFDLLNGRIFFIVNDKKDLVAQISLDKESSQIFFEFAIDASARCEDRCKRQVGSSLEREPVADESLVNDAAAI